MTLLNRRELLRTTAGLAAFMGLGSVANFAFAQQSGSTPAPFTYEGLVARAREMAAAPYVPPYRPRPDVIQQINYEEHGKLKFRTDDAPFSKGDGAYPLSFFHLGQYFGKSVKIHVVHQGLAHQVEYRPSLFDMPGNSPARQLPEDSGFAGFRLQEWKGASDWRTQDWVAFLGASYFRAIGGLGQYGLSARGVAVDAGVHDKPEEFPDFTEFYIEQSTDPEAPVIVCALLDGPSITGGFRFALKRGLDRSKGVTMDIESALFLREDIDRLGLIPLTSMFWYGEYGRERTRDWRPEVHDSDGLAMWTGKGERIWRPLNNPPLTTVSAFSDENPHGFGLLQRDRNFDHYQDGVMYDRRPSLWVEPLKPLGKGEIQLLELRTDDEIHDNVGAFWVPAGEAKAGNEYNLHYRLHWLADEPYPAENIALTTATRIGTGGEPGKPRPENLYRFAVEFNRPSVMTKIPYGVFPDVIVTASTGQVVRRFAEPVPNGNIWRAVFDLQVEPHQLVELRLYMALNGEPLTETWMYQFDRRNISS